MKRKKILLISIIILLISLIGGTLSWVTLRMTRTSMVLTIGDSSGTTMVSIRPFKMEETLYPVPEYDDVNYIDIMVNNTKSEASLVGLYFKIKSIDNALLDEGFTYAIEKSSDGTNYTLCTTCGGNFLHALDNNRMYILEESINPGRQYYRVYIYIDGTSTNQATMSGSSLDLEVRATLEEVGSYTKILVNNNDDLVYKVNHSAISTLAKTTDYRYYGIGPNNYVCLDYDGSNTCPDRYLYRIIGIVRNDKSGDNELKLIKATPIVNDSSSNTFAWDSSVGNTWSSSSLKTLLNTDYLNKSTTFTTNGLNSNIQELLSEATYYTDGLGNNTNTNTADIFYNAERNSVTGVDSYVGLMYPSDYGYASSNTCYLNNTTNMCNTKNWLNNIYNEWTITKSTAANDIVYYKSDSNNILYDTSNQTSSLYTVRPTIYISSKAIIGSGLGTQTNPYTLKVQTLYGVLRDAARIGTYATQYTGQHQDDFLGTRSTENIYHWYGVANSAGTANENGIAITDMYNVVFGGFCWQMIRTTDTGGVRLLYNGIPTTNTVNGKMTYYCGPVRFDPTTVNISLNGSFYYASSYTTSVSGNLATYTLTNPQQITVNSSNGKTTIPDIAENYPYTCRNSNTNSCDILYRVVSRQSGFDAYVNSTSMRSVIDTSKFNASSSSVADVGYMYDNSTRRGVVQSYSAYAKSLTISTASSYLIGDSLINNSDGTISLSGNVSEVAGSTWSTDYGNYTSKFVCLPGYYNATTYVCSDTRTTNDVQAVGYITATTSTNMTYRPVYKYGNSIELDSGTTYKLVGDGITQNKLQYIYNWNATTTTGCFADNTYYTSGNVSSCGYKSLDYSHYTCFNLSGKCDTYYYISFVTANYPISTPISDGKYVSTDITDTNNILYDMLYSPNVNTNDSTIKRKIDTWYQTNLYTNYDSYIDDTVYCNDRSITSFGGWDPDGGSNINSLKFKEYTVSSDLSCTNITDKFSQANTSAQLTYKVGLISSPELNLLNYTQPITRVNIQYWLLSPKLFDYNGYIVCMNQYGQFTYQSSSDVNSRTVRPAISLIANLTYSTGTGTKDDPYIVDAPPINNS